MSDMKWDTPVMTASFMRLANRAETEYLSSHNGTKIGGIRKQHEHMTLERARELLIRGTSEEARNEILGTCYKVQPMEPKITDVPFSIQKCVEDFVCHGLPWEECEERLMEQGVSLSEITEIMANMANRPSEEFLTYNGVPVGGGRDPDNYLTKEHLRIILKHRDRGYLIKMIVFPDMIPDASAKECVKRFMERRMSLAKLKSLVREGWFDENTLIKEMCLFVNRYGMRERGTYISYSTMKQFYNVNNESLITNMILGLSPHDYAFPLDTSTRRRLLGTMSNDAYTQEINRRGYTRDEVQASMDRVAIQLASERTSCLGPPSYEECDMPPTYEFAMGLTSDTQTSRV